MTRRPPRSTLTDTLCPYTTLFRSAGIGFGISPLAQAGLDEPFGLAVGLRRVRLGADVLEAEVSASLSEIEGSVAGAVVGHDAADGDAEAGVVGHRRLEERDGAFLALGGQHLGERHARVIVDADMDEFPAAATRGDDAGAPAREDRKSTRRN